MQTTTTQPRRRELRAIVQSIRANWTDEERERRRRIGEARQEWLLGMLEQAAGRTRAAS